MKMQKAKTTSGPLEVEAAVVPNIQLDTELQADEEIEHTDVEYAPGDPMKNTAKVQEEAPVRRIANALGDAVERNTMAHVTSLVRRCITEEKTRDGKVEIRAKLVRLRMAAERAVAIASEEII